MTNSYQIVSTKRFNITVLSYTILCLERQRILWTEKKIDWNILVLPDQCSRTFWAFSRYRYRDTINAGIWLVGDTDTPWQWGVHWMETQFLAIFLLFKKGTATSIFNNSPALYRFICSTCVQILGDLSVWAPKLCFSEVRKHIVKFKS